MCTRSFSVIVELTKNFLILRYPSAQSIFSQLMQMYLQQLMLSPQFPLSSFPLFFLDLGMSHISAQISEIWMCRSGFLTHWVTNPRIRTWTGLIFSRIVCTVFNYKYRTIFYTLVFISFCRPDKPVVIKFTERCTWNWKKKLDKFFNPVRKNTRWKQISYQYISRCKLSYTLCNLIIEIMYHCWFFVVTS